MLPARRDPRSLLPSGTSDVREVLRAPPPPAVPSAPEPAGSWLVVAVTTALTETRQHLRDPRHHRLLLVQRGTLSLASHGEERHLVTGDALWCGPGDAVEVTLAAGDPSHMLLVAAWPGPGPSATQPLRDAAGRLGTLLQWIQVERQATFVGANAYRSTLLELVVQEWERLGDDAAGVLEKRLRAYVLDHLAEPLSLDELAMQIGIGRYHLCRKYREVTGESPMQAVRALRLAEARKRLQSTTAPMRVIAQQVGLGSEQHLSRLLRRHCGVGAKDLRRGRAPEPAE